MSRAKRGAASTVIGCLTLAMITSKIVAAPPATIEQVLQEWDARQKKVKTARFSWDQREHVPQGSIDRIQVGRNKGKKPNPATDITFGGKCRLSIEDGKLRYEYDGHEWSAVHYELRPKKTVSTFDGTTYKSLVPVNPIISYPSAVVKQSARGSEFSYLSVRPIWLAVRGTQSVSQGFPLSQHEPTGRTVTVNGRPCHEYATKDQTSGTQSQLYLDPERDHLLVRRLETTNGIVQLKLDVTYARNDEIGWLPETWEYVTRTWLGQTDISVVCKLRAWEINPTLAPTEFDAELPTGTRVFDLTGGQRSQYVIRENGEKGRAVEGPVNVTYDQLIQAGPARPSWRTTILVLAAVGVAVSLCVLTWCRLARRSRTAGS